MRVLPFLLMPVLAACTSTEEKVAHNEAQIRMIAVQREAQKEERAAAAEAQKQLYISLQKVAEADPSQAGVVAMALAMQGMQGGNNEQPNTPIVPLQARQQSEALQWAQALSPVAGGLITTLGVSAINASVQKDQIAANRDIQTNSQNQHAAVVGSVAALGREALVNAGDNYAGDVYTLTDQAYIDQSTSTVTTNTTTSTTTQTVTDAYNTDSYNATDSSTSIADAYNTTNTTDTDTTLNNTVTSNTTVTWGGEETTLGSLLAYLAGLGSPYSLTINGVMVASSDEGEGETEAVTCVPDFSPSGYNCTGG
jgi:hypothetical protein